MFQTRKSIAIAKDFRMAYLYMNTVHECSVHECVVLEMKLYIHLNVFFRP